MAQFAPLGLAQLTLVWLLSEVYINTQILYINCLKSYGKNKDEYMDYHLSFKVNILPLMLEGEKALTWFTRFSFYGWKLHFPPDTLAPVSI